ncbi:MAG TPA: hypothetical protein VJZ91_15970, partial [Blastocatellia bacterium]|nr:hypothetical protein [Blastocatellia bacterium]
MSYLNLPRLCFAGKFSADPSTFNNTPQNYDPRVTAPNPGWNPTGTGQWQFIGCTVQAVYYADGTVCTSAEQDPIIGAAFMGANQRQMAKIVDLDPEQQMVSQIWGQRVQLGVFDLTDSLLGNYEVAAFTDIWFRAVGAGASGDAPMGASYQSVITNLRWGQSLTSRFLKELHGLNLSKLSIKFNLDGINLSSGTPTFTQGRIVGAIGPAYDGEPDHFVAGRLLRAAPTPTNDPYNAPATLLTAPGAPIFFTPCQVDEKRKVVTVDVGNSISTTTPGGPMNTALGRLALAALPQTAPRPLIGEINYQAQDWYTTTAGIEEFPLSEELLSLIANQPLGIVQIASWGKINPLIQENSLGAFVRADRFVFRMDPGDEVEVQLYATVFGKPAVNQTISLVYDPDSVNNMQSPPNPPSIPIGVPESALQISPTCVTTDEQGRASFKLIASDPKNPRKFIDGQVYGVRYIWGEQEPEGYNHDPTSFISVLVHNTYIYKAPPTWKRDVEPIFSQYAKLYPFMTQNVINLADYEQVTRPDNLRAIRRVLSLPKDDPGYMQVTRDMSRDKTQMI